MFWTSVGDGLKVLLYWETYVLGLIYLIFAYIPFFPMMFSKEKSEFPRGSCLAMILQPFFMSLGAIIYIMSLFPIIIGISGDASWSLPWLTIVNTPLFVLLIVVVIVVLSLLTAFIPLIGQMDSFATLVMGGTVVIFTVVISPSLGLKNVDIIPGLFTTLGILVISFISFILGLLVASPLATLINLGEEEGVGSLLMTPLGSAFGFIPVFIYGAWIGNQLAL